MTIEQLKLHMMDDFKMKLMGQREGKQKATNNDDDGIFSDDCKENEQFFRAMNEKEKIYHIEELWRRCYIKSKASQQVLTFFNDLSRKIQLFGVSNGLEQIK